MSTSQVAGAVGDHRRGNARVVPAGGHFARGITALAALVLAAVVPLLGVRCAAPMVKHYPGPRLPRDSVTILLIDESYRYGVTIDGRAPEDWELLHVRGCGSCLHPRQHVDIRRSDYQEVHIAPGRHMIEVTTGGAYSASGAPWRRVIVSASDSTHFVAQPGHVYSIYAPSLPSRIGVKGRVGERYQYRGYDADLIDITDSDSGKQVLLSTGRRYRAWWSVFSVFEGSVGLPSYYRIRFGTWAVGLPPPIGVGLGVTTIEASGPLKGAGGGWGTIIPTLYYVPWADWEKDGFATYLVYSSVSLGDDLTRETDKLSANVGVARIGLQLEFGYDRYGVFKPDTTGLARSRFFLCLTVPLGLPGIWSGFNVRPAEY